MLYLSLFIIVLIFILVIIFLSKKSKEYLSGGSLYTNKYEELKSSFRFLDSSGVKFDASYNPSVNGYSVSREIFDNVFIGDIIGNDKIGSSLIKKILPNSINGEYILVPHNPIISDISTINIQSNKPFSHVLIKDKTGNERGSGTLYNQASKDVSGNPINIQYVISAAHVIETVETDASDNKYIKDPVFVQAFTDSSGIYVKVKKSAILIHYDPFVTYINAKLKDDDEHWFPSDDIYIPYNRYVDASLNGTKILRMNDQYDLTIIKLQKDTSYNNITPSFNVPLDIYNEFIGPGPSMVELRGSLVMDPSEGSDKTKIYPYQLYPLDAKMEYGAHASYGIFNTKDSVVLATVCLTRYGPGTSYSKLAIPYTDTPLYYTRDMVDEDLNSGNRMVYGGVSGTLCLTLHVNMILSPMDSSSSYINDVIQIFGIGDINSTFLGFGFIGTSFGVIARDGVSDTLKIRKIYKNIQSNMNYEYCLEYNGFGGIFSKTFNFTLAYFLNKNKMGGTSISLKTLPPPKICYYTLTQKDTNTTKSLFAIPLYTMIQTNRLYYNRGNLYTCPEGRPTLEFFNDIKENNILSLHNYDASLNSFIYATTGCYEPSGSDVCSSRGLIPPSINPVNNGPLPIVNPVTGDSGGGCFYQDPSSNTLYLVAILIIGSYIMGSIPDLIYARRNHFNILLDLTQFNTWLNDIINKF